MDKNAISPKLKDDLYKAKVSMEIRAEIMAHVKKDSEGNAEARFEKIILKSSQPSFSKFYDSENHIIIFDCKKGFKRHAMQSAKAVLNKLSLKISIVVE